jgi:general secretion pathway protein N
MAGCEMMRKLAIGISVLALSVYGGTSASISAISKDALDDQADGAPTGPAAASTWTNPAATVVQVTVAPPAPAAPAPERTLSANPLWAMPLAQFSVTRDRPIFSPSRRPPPAAVAPIVAPKVAALPKPREPERPQLTLVGTIASDEEGFGIFLDQSTKAVLRLKVGEEFQGWKLRSVQGRETALEKDQQVVTLALPQPGVGQVTSEVPPPPPAIPRLRSSESRERPGR